MTKAERKGLLRVASTYKTASTKALHIVTGIIPIHLLAEERAILYVKVEINERVRKEVRRQTMEKWQNEWYGTTDLAQWTKTLIPDVLRWAKCEHRQTEYFLTQILTGHGCFMSYLMEIGKRGNDTCMYCPDSDDSNHTLFTCPKWQTERIELETRIGERLDENNLVTQMITSKANWESIHGYIISIMKVKEQDDRAAGTILVDNVGQ